MHRTRAADVAAPFIVAAIVSYLFVRSHYGDFPLLQFVLPLPFLILAVVEFALVRRIRGVIRHDPDVKPVPAIFVARCVALGKASAIIGALMAGAAAGMALWVAPHVGSVSAASHDTVVAVLLAASCVTLVVAGLLLESSGIVPGDQTPTGRPWAQ
jgi:hypothetical protein